MKKVLGILVLVLFLTIPATAEIKISLSLGGAMTSLAQGYDFYATADFRLETLLYDEIMPNLGMSFGPYVGIGIYINPQVELYGSYSSYSGEVAGTFSASVPHYWFWDQPFNLSATTTNKVKGSVLNFGVCYHPYMRGTFKPYIGGGLTSINTTMDVVNDVEFADDIWWTYSWYSGYSYYEEMTIDSVNMREEKLSCLIPHIKGGFDLLVSRTIALFLEAGYAIGKEIEVIHPAEINAVVDWEGDNTISINLGGFSASIGFKIFFGGSRQR